MKPPLLAYCFFALSTVGCGGAADIPETPDLRVLLASYEHPSASIDGANVAETIDTALKSAPDLQALAAGIKAARVAMGDIDYASKASSGRGGERVRLQGSLALNIHCPGERSDPVYDESINGSLTLTLAVADNKIRRGLAGEGKACVLQGTLRGVPARIELDGAVAFDLGGDIGLGQPWTGELLASLPGELHVGEVVFQSISARLHEGRFQHLLSLPDNMGTIVLELSDTGITVRDGSRVWFCKEGESCAQP